VKFGLQKDINYSRKYDKKKHFGWGKKKRSTLGMIVVFLDP